MALDQAYATCLRLAREHYENFPVASRLLPAQMRPHVAAVYAFARTADDFADEGSLTIEDRLGRLDRWLARLHAAVQETAGIRNDDPQADHIFEALANTIRVCDLEVGLFEDLLSAFRQDVTVHRYATWSDVLDYCRRSANPVGRLVLRIGGWRASDLDTASDALCTALQLTNFWQDFRVDWRRGRLYLPQAECAAAGADTADLVAGRITPPWRTALSQATAVTRDLFWRGRPVCDSLRGRLRYELRLTWLGGMRILERLERDHFDVFNRRPTLGVTDAPILAWRFLTWDGRLPVAASLDSPEQHRPASRHL